MTTSNALFHYIGAAGWDEIRESGFIDTTSRAADHIDGQVELVLLAPDAAPAPLSSWTTISDRWMRCRWETGVRDHRPVWVRRGMTAGHRPLVGAALSVVGDTFEVLEPLLHDRSGR
ncbi:hypothetical protein ACICHK_03930 [Streptomyces sp. AHU1]|uniref:hypothetical protein n=1 Tax=Streptomyces sp. AHU1 TaxID=3377215 RepID=UPI0038779039